MSQTREGARELLGERDPEAFHLLQQEEERQKRTIDLIAAENYASRAVLEAQGSIFTNKYAEGYPHQRYYAGCGVVDEVEALATERAKKLFGAEHANLQPHSGAQPTRWGPSSWWIWPIWRGWWRGGFTPPPSPTPRW